MGRIQRYSVIFITFSIVYVVIFPLLVKAQKGVSKFIARSEEPIKDPLETVKALEILEKFNENKITIKQTMSLIRLYSNISQAEIDILLDANKVSP